MLYVCTLVIFQAQSVLCFVLHFIGFLTITGRSKEILITKGGENVAPVPLEGVSIV